MFHQLEGLVIDRSANVANMRWVLEEFCKAFFEVPQLEDPLPAELLPVHGAEPGSRRPVRPLAAAK